MYPSCNKAGVKTLPEDWPAALTSWSVAEPWLTPFPVLDCPELLSCIWFPSASHCTAILRLPFLFPPHCTFFCFPKAPNPHWPVKCAPLELKTTGEKLFLGLLRAVDAFEGKHANSFLHARDDGNEDWEDENWRSEARLFNILAPIIFKLLCLTMWQCDNVAASTNSDLRTFTLSRQVPCPSPHSILTRSSYKDDQFVPLPLQNPLHHHSKTSEFWEKNTTSNSKDAAIKFSMYPKPRTQIQRFINLTPPQIIACNLQKISFKSCKNYYTENQRLLLNVLHQTVR